MLRERTPSAPIEAPNAQGPPITYKLIMSLIMRLLLEGHPPSGSEAVVGSRRLVEHCKYFSFFALVVLFKEQTNTNKPTRTNQHAADGDGRLPLHYAEHVSACRLLLQHCRPSDAVDRSDRQGRTPLARAARLQSRWRRSAVALAFIAHRSRRTRRGP